MFFFHLLSNALECLFKVSADKLAREVQLYGNPPIFSSLEEDSNAEDTEEAKPENGNAFTPDKFKSMRSKAAAKSSGYKFQGEFMMSLGLSNEEIAKFQDPYHWLSYFPPLAKEDLIAFGLGCDWRSSCITTDMNPYYDSFVRWQMSKLKSLGKIVKDMRYIIYSPLDG